MTIIESSEATRAEEAFALNPSDGMFKNLCVAWIPFYFLTEFLAQGKGLLSRAEYNHLAYLACGAFFREYRCEWKEWGFPTLCLAGDTDLIAPLSLFQNDPAFSGKANVDFAEILKAGHFPGVENFADFAAAIR